jgi:hypothetical protein
MKTDGIISLDKLLSGNALLQLCPLQNRLHRIRLNMHKAAKGFKERYFLLL